jgi:hypothetical protein
MLTAPGHGELPATAKRFRPTRRGARTPGPSPPQPPSVAIAPDENASRHARSQSTQITKNVGDFLMPTWNQLFLDVENRKRFPEPEIPKFAEVVESASGYLPKESFEVLAPSLTAKT